ncbi:MAG: hypothetical protein WC706_05725 [Sideroxydans sp.]|jgi:hypothetical protein
MRHAELTEYEQEMQRKALESTALRKQRKAARASIAATRVKQPALSLSGDTVLFDGGVYSLYYAHGGLQIDRAFKADLKSKGYKSEARREIFEQIKRIAAESSSASRNIYGSPLAGQMAITEQCKAMCSYV